MTDETTLLPCPFCPDGGNPIKTCSGKEPYTLWYSCRCSQCDASIGLYDTSEEADRAWNSRYTEDDLK